jgi:L-2-hydroxycarboxylate dehydrogenase (NAD+)
VAERSERIPVARLARFVADAYRAVGVPPDDAGTAARLMLESDLVGADGHGIFRLPQYVRRIRAGGLNVAPNIRVVEGGAAAAVVDGDNGLGHLVMRTAAELLRLHPEEEAQYPSPMSGKALWTCGAVTGAAWWT